MKVKVGDSNSILYSKGHGFELFSYFFLSVSSNHATPRPYTTTASLSNRKQVHCSAQPIAAIQSPLRSPRDTHLNVVTQEAEHPRTEQSAFVLLLLLLLSTENLLSLLGDKSLLLLVLLLLGGNGLLLLVLLLLENGLFLLVLLLLGEESLLLLVLLLLGEESLLLLVLLLLGEKSLLLMLLMLLLLLLGGTSLLNSHPVDHHFLFVPLQVRPPFAHVCGSLVVLLSLLLGFLGGKVLIKYLRGRGLGWRSDFGRSQIGEALRLLECLALAYGAVAGTILVLVGFEVDRMLSLHHREEDSRLLSVRHVGPTGLHQHCDGASRGDFPNDGRSRSDFVGARALGSRGLRSCDVTPGVWRAGSLLGGLGSFSCLQHTVPVLEGGKIVRVVGHLVRM